MPQSKKHILLTGATSGIGASILKKLAQEDLVIVFVARNEEKACRLLEELQPHKAEIHFLMADLSQANEAQAIAEAYRQQYSRLDILINNAGAMFSQLQKNSAGIEMNIAMNYLSSFILSTALQSLMQETAAAYGEARILNITSEAHMTGVFWDDFFFERHAYNMMSGYSQSKAMMILFTQELAKQSQGTNLSVNAVHPGGVRTAFGVNSGSKALAIIFRLLAPFLLSADKAAENIIRLATAPEYQGISGQYFSILKQMPPKLPKHSQNQGQELWQVTEQWLAQTN